MNSRKRDTHSPKAKRTGLKRLGLAIRKTRKEQGVTQAYLATCVGKSATTIARIERGENQSLDHKTVQTIADALGVSHLKLIWGAQRSLLHGEKHTEPIRVVDRLVAALAQGK